jgi:hypothetical protein
MYIVSCLFLALANTVSAHHPASTNRIGGSFTVAPYRTPRAEAGGLRHVFAQVPLYPAARYDHVTFLMSTAPFCSCLLGGEGALINFLIVPVLSRTMWAVANDEDVGGPMHVRRYKRTQMSPYIF